MLIVIVCMIFMYIWPGMTLWLPNSSVRELRDAFALNAYPG
jgi:hypothetical protein